MIEEERVVLSGGTERVHHRELGVPGVAAVERRQGVAVGAARQDALPDPIAVRHAGREEVLAQTVDVLRAVRRDGERLLGCAQARSGRSW